MARIFTLKDNEPIYIELRGDDAGAIPTGGTEVGDRDRWVVIPAGTALAVTEFQRTWYLLSEDGTSLPAEPFTVDVDVIVYKDGAIGSLPVEVGIFGEGQADDLSGLRALTRDEATQLHPEFADVFTVENDPEFEEQERAEAEWIRQSEALAEVEHREGRHSVAYRMQLRETPHGVRIGDLAEIAELYDDDQLRQAIDRHPDTDVDEWDDGCERTDAAAAALDEEVQRGAARGRIARMLVAEAILQPGIRQVDLKERLGISSDTQSKFTYLLGKAGVLHRTLEKSRVVLAPTDCSGELGLDEVSATELVAWRDDNPADWDEIIQRAMEPAQQGKQLDLYEELRDNCRYASDDGSVPFGPDAPSARAWPGVPDERAGNPHILRWWTPECDEAIAELIDRWRWHYPEKLTDAVVAVVGKEVIDRWAAEDPVCQQYVYYNVLLNFGIARARRVGLERALPMPQTRVCSRCRATFEEDLAPLRRARAENPQVDHDCGRCK